MRIEVLVGNDDPVVYPLNAQKMAVGTSENCDIILSADGVSRKHLVIVTEGDSFYVIDQGSTNGSFINEERLIPGRKIEFTSFFPVRLGDNVLISLLSDEEAEIDGPIELPASFKSPAEKPAAQTESMQDKTSIISLKDLNKVKTETLIQTRNTKRATVTKKKNNPKAVEKPKKKKNFVPLISLLIVVAAGAYSFMNKKEDAPPEKIEEVGKIVKKKVPEAPKPKNPYLVDQNELTPKTTYNDILTEIKCTTDVESPLCDYFPGAREGQFGVVQVGLTIHVLIDGTTYFEEAKKHVAPPIDDSTITLEAYNKILGDTAVYLYLIKVTKLEPLDISKLKDFKFSIALFNKKEDKFVPERIVAFTPLALPVLKESVFEQNLFYIRSNGETAMLVTKDKYTVY